MAERLWRRVRPLAFRLDPERAHNLAIAALSRAPGATRLVTTRLRVHDERLAQELMGIRFPNPVGLAAGFDKFARAIPAWAALGFGFVEIGSVTALAQPGNPTPRMFRLQDDRAIINRLGFNNDGADATARRLERYRERGRLGAIPLGVNIGKSKVAPLDRAVDDYLTTFRALREFADYVVVNVSSPNTPGLRDLQQRSELEGLLAALTAENRGMPRPILVKIAPDLTPPQVDDILELVDRLDVTGLVISNTTIARDGLVTRGALRDEAGGLSGRPLAARSTALIRHARTGVGTRRVIVGVGGVFDASDAWEKLAAGANLVQVYTGFVYGGPATAARINRGLVDRMRAEGVNSVSEIVGNATSADAGAA